MNSLTACKESTAADDIAIMNHTTILFFLTVKNNYVIFT